MHTREPTFSKLLVKGILYSLVLLFDLNFINFFVQFKEKAFWAMPLCCFIMFVSLLLCANLQNTYVVILQWKNSTFLVPIACCKSIIHHLQICTVFSNNGQWSCYHQIVYRCWLSRFRINFWVPKPWNVTCVLYVFM